MNRSYSKKRHIQEANILLEQRTNKTFMTESQSQTQSMAQNAINKAKSGENNPNMVKNLPLLQVGMIGKNGV